MLSSARLPVVFECAAGVRLIIAVYRAATVREPVPEYFLGVDGGQSSTTAVIGDDTGRVVGVGYGGPCNHVGASEGRAKLVGAIQSSLRGACAQAGLDAESVNFTSACLGFSGGP